ALCSRRHRWPWRLLLLAWLSLGCGVGTAQPARGAWGSWGPWSSCSSSCGDGVALRTRRCLRSAEEEPCTGDPRQYRLCQLQDCPGGSVPFRAMQCSLYDNKPVLGTPGRYRWVPFHGAPNLCDLNCLAVGHNFYFSFGRVLDGTRCGPGSPDLCVGGRCLSVGCDGILGSGSQPDACGQCGGGHGSCLFVHRLFQGMDPSSGYFGYMNVTKIPAGATHIKVTDKSRNYLGRTCPVSLPVSPSPSQSVLVGATHGCGQGRAGQGWLSHAVLCHAMLCHAVPCHAVPCHVVPLCRAVPRRFPRSDPVFSTVVDSRRGRGSGVRPGGPCPAQGAPHTHPKVFQGRILARRLVGQETRYEVEVKARYRHRSPLVSREYVWVPNTCGCPPLREGHQYLLMARRHVNHE
ncbi:ATL5 protein, partial [Aegotheles bennettii]|nr:ATL5 protein [Aegotheles bennettii]